MDEVNLRSEQQSGLTGKYGEEAEAEKERSRLKGLEEAKKRAIAATNRNYPQSERTTDDSGPNTRPAPFQSSTDSVQAQQQRPQSLSQPEQQTRAQPFVQNPSPSSSFQQQRQQQQAQDRTIPPIVPPTASQQSNQSPGMQVPITSLQEQRQQSEGQSWMSSEQQVSSAPAPASSPFEQQRQEKQSQDRSRPSIVPPSVNQQSNPPPRIQVPSTPPQQEQGKSKIALNDYPNNQRNTGSDLDQQAEVNEMILNADANYIPSKRALIADSSELLLQEVDGDLSFFSSFGGDSDASDGLETTVKQNSKETIYKANNINVYGESFVSIPIKVPIAGSVVEYTIEKKNHDFLFGIESRVGQGQEIVKVSYMICRVGVCLV
jgi:hypothetical protein